MRKHILLVENDPILTQSLVNHCRYKNYDIVTCVSNAEAINNLESSYFDLAIIDRRLEDGDGLETVEYLTSISPRTKILICSQLGDVKNRIHSLSLGADSCIPKPFSFTELSLKIEKLLAYEKTQQESILTAGSLVVSPDTGTVQLANKTCYLRKRELQILVCLLKHRNRVVTRERLLSYVWGLSENQPAYSTLDVYIRRIRIALGKGGNSLITTVRGFGYCVNG